jgi:hypothetical protein
MNEDDYPEDLLKMIDGDDWWRLLKMKDDNDYP